MLSWLNYSINIVSFSYFKKATLQKVCIFLLFHILHILINSGAKRTQLSIHHDTSTFWFVANSTSFSSMKFVYEIASFQHNKKWCWNCKMSTIIYLATLPECNSLELLGQVEKCKYSDLILDRMNIHVEKLFSPN